MAGLNTDKILFIATLLNSRDDAKNYMEVNLYLSLNQDIIPKEEFAMHLFIVNRNLAVSGFAILAFWISSFKKKPLK